MTEHRHGKQNSDPGFEREDLGAKPVYGFMISLAVFGVLIYYLIWGMFHFLDAYERKHQAGKSPLVQYQQDTRTVAPGTITQFPEPRLETDERGEINDFRYREEETLNSYGWVDQNAGIVHIPIDRAMQLVAERGLPTTPKAGTVPPSTVSMVNQAAAKADTSGVQKSPAKEPPGKGKSQ
jgi:hypothetical protein